MSEAPLFVPVREGAFTLSLRLFRTASGRRTAVAFTSPVRLAKVLGPDQRWIRLGERALRGMTAALGGADVVDGVDGLVIDPAGTMDPARTVTGAA